jgi:hypothetical protein
MFRQRAQVEWLKAREKIIYIFKIGPLIGG